MQGQAKCVFVDKISNLPLPIIENILCSLPIKEAVRTSILSRNWRYNWTGIPKLVFDDEIMFDEVKSNNQIFSAIRQVLILHRGPIIEFSVSMFSFSIFGRLELDQIIHDLARNKDTLKKLTLHFRYECNSYQLPLSIFSFQQLTNLYFSHCRFEFNPTFSAFGSLTSLYFHTYLASSKALLHLLSSCPLLKRLKLAFKMERIHMYKWEGITFHELSKCLPVIEHLSFNCRVIECCFQDYAWRELPTALVNLKHIALYGTVLFDGSHLPFLCHVLRSSPNLEKIKLTMYGGWYDPDKSNLESNMRDCSDIWLENLKELKISCFDNSRFSNLEGESRFVKLILAKSPVLKKVIIELSNKDADRQLWILSTLLQSPRASSAAEIIVTYGYIPWNDYSFSEPFGFPLVNL